MKITLTVDGNANQKALRKLERQGFVDLHVINMESALTSGKINNKQMPLAVIESPHSTIGNCVISSNETIFKEISIAMTKANHGDAMQLEGHIRSGRDIFVTGDKDFLERRGELYKIFGVKIKSTEEVIAMFNI